MAITISADSCNVEEVCSEYAAEGPFLGKDCKCYCPGTIANPFRLCSQPKRGMFFNFAYIPGNIEIINNK